MIRNIAIAISTILLFAVMAWTTIAAAPQDMNGDVSQMQVTYTLPYPGILPDSPLYFLKTFRDKLVSFFITDAEKQGHFDLLQADKHLAAAQYMLDEKNPPAALISQTLSKGENYFDDAIQNIIQAKKEGRLINDFLGTLADASIKHQQVLLEMSTKTQGQLHKDLLTDVIRVQGFENQVTKLKTQK